MKRARPGSTTWAAAWLAYAVLAGCANTQGANTAVRDALSVLLPDLTFVSSHPSLEDFLAAAPRADVVILDLHLVNLRQPDAAQGVAAIHAAVDAGYRVCVYTQEERRFVPMNDVSAWYRCKMQQGRVVKTKFHIR